MSKNPNVRRESQAFQNEEEFLAEVRRLDPSGIRHEMVVPNGDDAAVIAWKKEDLVVTVDACLEGKHFDLSYFSLEQVGRKAIEVSASDIVAMGGAPTHCLISLVVRKDFGREEARLLYQGIYAALARLQATLVGGNVSSSENSGLELHITFFGKLLKAPITRGAARAGDVLVVTGPLGDAAAGLLILQEGQGGPEALTRKQLEPRCRNDLADKLARSAHAMMDISDGLSKDLPRLCGASKQGAVVYEKQVPYTPALSAWCQERGEDALRYALHGGEDYELLIAMDRSDWDPSLGTVIGEIQGSKVLIRGEKGDVELASLGYDHFSRTS